MASVWPSAKDSLLNSDDAFILHQRQIHTLSPTLIAAFTIISIILPTLLYLHHEYLAFIALGPGGTANSFAGFLKVHALSFTRIPDPYRLPNSHIASIREVGRLRDLPVRSGPRPVTRGIAPHRQVTSRGSAATHDLLVTALGKLGASKADMLIGTSCFEKHSTGLFVTDPHNHTCGGEVCHTHPSDGGSMHLTLYAADLKTVLEAGWGERHPLSRGGWFERFVPAGFTMVYAPRDEDEVAVVMRIVDAAACYVRGERAG